MKNELKILFSTTSDQFTLNELNEDFKLSPDRGYSKGDLLPNISRHAKVTLWSLAQECPSFSLEKGMDELMKRIAEDDLIQRFKKHEFHLEVVCYMVDRSLDLNLTNLQLKFIADLGCSFGIDYYILPKDDKEG